MTEIQRPPSLVARVTETIRRGIRCGEWVNPLPGELALCEQMRISRTTLRAALQILRREGLIVVSRGKRMRVVLRQRWIAPRVGSKIVGLLSILPSHLLSSFSHFLISELQEYLHSAGYNLEVHADPRFGSRNPARSLTQLMSDSRADCWVLLPPTTACARWFADHPVPCLVVGSCELSAAFPSVDVDLHAVSRHAVGILRGRGCSRMALIVTDVAGLRQGAIVDGFLESFRATGGPREADPLILHVPDMVAEIKTDLDSLFASTNRPTGLLVARPKHVLTVMTHLANSGIRVPQHVSVICLGHDPYLDNLTPSVAHYTFNWKSFARRVSAMVRELADTGNLPCRKNLVMPQFQTGETLRTAD